MNFWGIFGTLLCCCTLCLAAKNITKDSFVCGEGKFRCSSLMCVPQPWKCDGDRDCDDGSDEKLCRSVPHVTCKQSQFQCVDKRKCIPSRWRCDEMKDCSDNSDELDCDKQCPSGFFKCNNTNCIPTKWKCDSHNDCGDNTDEVGCPVIELTCKTSEFRCNNKQMCISKSWVCDREKDCADNSDELDCQKKDHPPCKADQFRCGSGRCIPNKWVCDKNHDCSDLSDETACNATTKKACQAGYMRCDSGECIREKWRCDGQFDCQDDSDEKDCSTVSCSKYQVQCKNGKECISKSLECNGIKDCSDGSDESDCSTKVDVCTRDHFNCSGSSTCLDWRHVCDGHKDCPSGDDESNECFINECKLNNGHCNQICIDLKIGFQCSCREGYELSDSRTCNDINECQIFGFCHQYCRNTKGSYKCSCAPGYYLESDKKSCKSVNYEQSWIYFANRHDIRRVSPHNHRYDVAIDGLQGATSMDFDVRHKYLYWTDLIGETINRAAIDSNQVEVIKRNVTSPDGLAVDWISGKIYWTEMDYKTIEVCDLNGKYNTDILQLSSTVEPRAISLDPIEGYIYWSDWGEKPAIERISMDGNPATRKAIVNENIVWPNGITVDLVQRKLYWIDAKLSQFEVVDFDGSNRRLLKTISHIHPFSLDNFQGEIFFTDWKQSKLSGISKFNPTNTRTIKSGLFAPMDVKVYYAARQPHHINPCGEDNFGCSHLCLIATNGKTRGASCKCPRGMYLLSPGSKKCHGTQVTRPPITTTTTAVSTPPTKTSEHDKHVNQMTKSPKKKKEAKSSFPWTIVAIVLSVVVGIILALVIFMLACRKRFLRREQVMFYKDMSTMPLEEDFDGEDNDEKAKIIPLDTQTDPNA